MGGPFDYNKNNKEKKGEISQSYNFPSIEIKFKIQSIDFEKLCNYW